MLSVRRDALRKTVQKKHTENDAEETLSDPKWIEYRPWRPQGTPCDPVAPEILRDMFGMPLRRIWDASGCFREVPGRLQRNPERSQEHPRMACLGSILVSVFVA